MDIKTSEDRSARITSRATVWIAVATVVTGFVAFATWWVISGQLNEMISDRRPFVGISEKEIETRPLIFTPQAMILEFTAPLKNVGKSVATSVTTHTSGLQIRPIIQRGVVLSEPAIDRELKGAINCNEASIQRFKNIGTIILPQDSWNAHIKQQFSRDVFHSQTDETVAAWLPFCIAYRDDAGRFHGTGFILEFLAGDESLEEFAPAPQVRGKLRIFPFGTSVF